MPTFVFTSPEGKKYKINGPNEQGARSALQHHLSKTAAPPQPTIDQSTDGPMEGFGAAFRYGIDAPLENMGETAEALGAEGTAAALRGATEAPEGYVSASGQFMNDPEGGFGWRYIPKATVEQAGQYAGSIASRLAGAGVGGAVGGPVGAIAGGLSAPALFEIVQQLGPIANERAKNSGRDKPNAEDWVWASSSATGMGVLNAIAPSAAGLFKRMIIEGGTEYIQSAIEQGGSTAATDKGLTIDPRQMAAEGILGGTSAGLVDTTIAAGKGTVGKILKSSPDEMGSQEQAAAGSLARRIDRIARQGDLNGKPFNLKNVDKAMDQHGARAALDATHTDLVGSINQKIKELKSILNITDEDPASVVFEKVQAGVATKMARNKTKSVVTKDNFDALTNLVGGTKEGQELLNLVLEAQALTELHNDGYQGGVSQFTDQFKIFGSNIGYDRSAQAVERMLRPIVSVGTGVATGGGTLAAQQGAVLAGRAIDAATGRRSKVNRFVNKNLKSPELPTPQGFSLREVQQLQQRLEQQEAEAAAQRTETEKQEREQLNIELAQQNAPPTPTSPQETMETATGLDRNGVARILRIIEATNDNPAIQRAIKDYRNSVGKGGRIEDNMISPLIRAVKQKLASEPRLDALRVREPEAGLQQQPQQQTSGRMFTSDENYQAGIEANQQMIQELSDQASQDETLRPIEKALIRQSLEALGRNLGSDPQAEAAAIVDRLATISKVPQAAIDQYVQPYVDRVIGQQQAKQSQLDRGAMRLSEEPTFVPSQDFGGTTDVEMATGLAKAYQFAKDRQFAKGRDFKIELQRMATEAQQREGIDLTQLTPENIDRLSDFVVGDALVALQDNENAIGWYDRTVTNALNTLSQVYPEILTNDKNKLQFIWALAVTSNGTKVDKNFELAAAAYEHLQRTGRFPTDIGIGEAAKAINGGLAQYHTMLEKFDRKTNSDEGDHRLLADFMNSQVPVKQIEAEYDVKISGEGKATLVRGASILGPKIGNGFFSNLYGNFDALTMDRWLMRSVGRWRGNLIDINKPMIKKKQFEIKGMISGMSKDQLKSLRAYLRPSGVRIGKTMSKTDINDLSAYIAKQSTSKPWREGLNAISNDVRKAANGLAKYRDGQVEAPAGPKERDFIRAVFTKALDRLNNNPIVKQASSEGLTMSDLQALLWYPEKRLYDTAKAPEGQESRGYSDDEAPDYANAARKLVQERGEVAVGSGLGSVGRDGSGGRGSALANAGLLSDVPQARQQLDEAPAGNPRGALFNAEENPQGVAGTLAQRMLQQPDDQNQLATRPPTIQEAAAQKEAVKALFEIGKKGSKYENGIQSIEDARKLAKALGQFINLYSDQQKMLKDTGYSPDRTGIRGLFTKDYQRGGSTGQVFGLRAGVEIPSGTITEFDSLSTFLHEVSHGLSMGPSSSERGRLTMSDLVDGKNKLKTRGKTEDTVRGSWESALLPLLAKANGTVVKEIQNLQHNIEVYSERNPNDRKAVRLIADLKQEYSDHEADIRSGLPDSDTHNLISHKRFLDKHSDYIQSLSEFAVDPIWVYLANPRLAKEVMPETTKMIRENFRAAKNPIVQFYAHPLAMGVAIMLAIMAQQEAADDEEEQQQQQMTAGALSPQMGVLSAA